MFYICAKFRDEIKKIVLCESVTNIRFSTNLVFFTQNTTNVFLYITKLCTYVEHLYMFVAILFRIFVNDSLFFLILLGQEHMSSAAKIATPTKY